MKLATLAAAVSSVVLSVTAPASADTLSNMLASVADASHFEVPLVATGKAEIDGVKGKVEDRISIVERPSLDAKAPPQVLVSFEAAKSRLLALGPTAFHLAADGKAKPAAPDAAVPPSSFTTEDFLPFAPERCAVVRIADMSDEQFTLICEPKKPPSQYSLLVYKFDREKAVPRQVLIYKDGNTNLVRMLRCDDFVQVGKSWRPKTVVLQDFKLRTKDTLTLEWRTEPKVAPEAFDAKSFAAASLPVAAKKP